MRCTAPTCTVTDQSMPHSWDSLAKSFTPNWHMRHKSVEQSKKNKKS